MSLDLNEVYKYALGRAEDFDDCRLHVRFFKRQFYADVADAFKCSQKEIRDTVKQAIADYVSQCWRLGI